MKNYYTGVKDYPHHVSVGAVLLNDRGKVACHYYKEKVRKYPPNFYTLMHESVEMGETLEQTLHRGLEEEFGVEAEIKEYVGSLVVNYTVDGDHPIEKTVLYFLCNLTGKGERNLDDPENQGDIVWLDISELILIMEKQGLEYGHSTDESKILKDVKKYFFQDIDVTNSK